MCSIPRGFKSIASSDGPRAAIYWRGNFEILKLEQFCEQDCAVGITKIGKNNLILVSGYLDINKSVIPSWMDGIIKYSNKKKYPVLFGIDSNAHSTLYGMRSNTRGEEFEDFILTNRIRVENVGESTTFETIRGGVKIESNIDVTLTYKLINAITDWSVDRSYNGSDHNTIYFTLKKHESYSQKVRKWESTDWDCLTAEINNRKNRLHVPTIINEKKLDKMLQAFYRVIWESLDIASPLVEVKYTTKDYSWFKKEHKKLGRKVEKAYVKYKNSGTPSDHDKYKKLQKIYKNKCRRDKSHSWKHFTDTVRKEKEIAKLTKKFKQNRVRC